MRQNIVKKRYYPIVQLSTCHMWNVIDQEGEGYGAESL